MPCFITRLEKGQPPLHDIFGVPKLHLIYDRDIQNANGIGNLKEVWPWEHADDDPFRYYNGLRP